MTSQLKAFDGAPVRIRVLIADDHAGVRHALGSVLMAYDDLELAGEAALGAKAILLCAQVQPDVVLMDLVMPGMSSVDAIRVIRERWPQIRVIALTSFQEIDLTQEALRAGAVCCLLKNVSADQLAEAIRAAFEYRSISFAQDCPKSNPGRQMHAHAVPDLVPRELRVLTWMVEGLSLSEIAERLTVNLLTARVHIENILFRLGVTSRSEAVVVALKHHLAAL
jgi:NarL family two-component system response regulator LiaR